MTVATNLPTFESQLDLIAAAEQGDGWLSDCIDSGRYLSPNRQLVDALAEFLMSLGQGAIVELCAGRGDLAEALVETGLAIAATDADPPAGSPVVRADAREALKRYRPTVVLGSFVPVDAGVDRLAMQFPSVRHYVVLNARIGGLLGSNWLWQTTGWKADSLDQISRWMLTRHDVWLGTPRRPILQHGEAWHFARRTDPAAQHSTSGQRRHQVPSTFCR